MGVPTPTQIRPATENDIAEILALIKGLADYEKSLNEVRATEDDLLKALFCDNPQVFALCAVDEEKIVGIAIWHLNFSTWLGKHGMYLEDLFVLPQYRKNGYGLALLSALAQMCLDRGYERFQWWVLDWNQPAIDFYSTFGAVAMDEWTVFRATQNAIQKMASATSPTNNQ